MSEKLITDKKYGNWLKQLRKRVRQVQLKAAAKVNTELLTFYWELGADIVEKQKETRWGDGFLTQLSKDLMAEFPDIKGFSKRNLEQIRRWYLFYNQDGKIAQQAASQLTQIPWWHNVIIVSKTHSIDEALFYVRKTIENGWSRSVLTHQIENGLINRAGKAITNFDTTLPAPQSDLAKETIKDPYCFDFLTMTEHFT